jgi:putative transcriptional regulator
MRARIEMPPKPLSLWQKMADFIQGQRKGRQVDLTGKLLAAMPGMQDPRFSRTLVLVCSHSAEGAMGLIVNRPMPEVPFATLLDRLGLNVATAIQIDVHYGGPVEKGRGFILHRDNFKPKTTFLDIDGGFRISATLDVLELIAEGTGAGPSPVLLAMGYAGWGPDQLEAEIAENAWLTLDGLPDIVFAEKAADKWADALRRIGVSPVALSGAAGRA